MAKSLKKTYLCINYLPTYKCRFCRWRLESRSKLRRSSTFIQTRPGSGPLAGVENFFGVNESKVLFSLSSHYSMIIRSVVVIRAGTVRPETCLYSLLISGSTVSLSSSTLQRIVDGTEQCDFSPVTVVTEVTPLRTVILEGPCSSHSGALRSSKFSLGEVWRPRLQLMCLLSAFPSLLCQGLASGVSAKTAISASHDYTSWIFYVIVEDKLSFRSILLTNHNIQAFKN